jgi:hypothetical protein
MTAAGTHLRTGEIYMSMRWMPRPSRLGRAGALALAALAIAGVARAQDRVVTDDEWCEGHETRDGYSSCEVREWTLEAPNDLAVDARPNGGISVEAWDRSDMLVRAKVHAWAESEQRAREITDEIEVDAGSDISADGPKNRSHEGWSVSYRIMVPAATDLDLESTNGGIAIEGVRGTLRFQTTNGGIHLEDVSGDVAGRTTNGGVHVALGGSAWAGKGLSVTTTNGGVRLSVPEGYSAHLETATTNGGLSIGFPVTVQGRIDRKLSVDLGDGGPTVSVKTTNGGVRITEG